MLFLSFIDMYIILAYFPLFASHFISFSSFLGIRMRSSVPLSPASPAGGNDLAAASNERRKGENKVVSSGALYRRIPVLPRRPLEKKTGGYDPLGERRGLLYGWENGSRLWFSLSVASRFEARISDASLVRRSLANRKLDPWCPETLAGSDQELDPNGVISSVPRYVNLYGTSGGERGRRSMNLSERG